MHVDGYGSKVDILVRARLKYSSFTEGLGLEPRTSEALYVP